MENGIEDALLVKHNGKPDLPFVDGIISGFGSGVQFGNCAVIGRCYAGDWDHLIPPGEGSQGAISHINLCVPMLLQ